MLQYVISMLINVHKFIVTIQICLHYQLAAFTGNIVQYDTNVMNIIKVNLKKSKIIFGKIIICHPSGISFHS